MKYIFWMLVFLFLCFSHTQANDDITVSLSQNHIQVGQEVQLKIDFQSQEIAEQELSVEIPGIENFEVFSQAQALNFQSIDGKTQSILSYTLSFSALQEGTYSLWPVSLWTGSGAKVDDVTLTLQVEKALSPALPGSKNWEISQENMLRPQEQDIRGLRNNSTLLWFFIFAVLTLWLSWYFLFSKVLIQNKQAEISTPEKGEEDISDVWDIDFFQNLRSQINTIPTQEFFQSFNEKIREIFSRSTNDFILSATLQELTKDKNIKTHPLFPLFERSYLAEYNLKEYSVEEKQQYIEDILTLL